MTPEIYAGLKPLERSVWNTNRRRLKNKINAFGSPKIDEFIFNKVITIICRHYELNRDKLVHGNTRGKKPKDYPFYRQISHYLIRKFHEDMGIHTTLEEIGKKFGGKHYSTILHSINKIKGLLTVDAETRREVKLIEEKIQNALS